MLDYENTEKPVESGLVELYWMALDMKRIPPAPPKARKCSGILVFLHSCPHFCPLANWRCWTKRKSTRLSEPSFTPEPLDPIVTILIGGVAAIGR